MVNFTPLFYVSSSDFRHILQRKCVVFQNVFSFRGALPPDPDQGFCPWTPLGALPPDPRYRFTLAMNASVPVLFSLGRDPCSIPYIRWEGDNLIHILPLGLVPPLPQVAPPGKKFYSAQVV